MATALNETQTTQKYAETRVGQPLPVADLPQISLAELRAWLPQQIASGGRVLSFFGRPLAEDTVRLYAVLGNADNGAIRVTTCVVGNSYPALTPDVPQLHWFEREIAEQWGVLPENHPWLKPIRNHHSYRPGHDAWGRTGAEEILPNVIKWFRIRGPEVHEVQVGPVHAGVIEPGAFRFQCHGEIVYHLEINLGYQYRGIEKRLRTGPHKRTLHYIETMAGDTTVGHTTSYCQIVEGLSGCKPSLRAQALRGIALELERLACHTGDLGALADDVAFLPTANYCGRLRGDFLNSTALLCGNRFSRGLIAPGGVLWDVDSARCENMTKRLKPALRDVAGACQLLWDTPSVMARFEDTGRVPQATSDALGLVGLAARASGAELDARHDFPSGIYRFHHVPVSNWHTGDVFARAHVRWLEIQRSGQFVLDLLERMPTGPIRQPVGPMQPESLAVGLTEGWRGECCHVGITDSAGQFAWYKVVDPSFHNWIGLAMALRSQQISDFPLCNKSFNLSYCGHDL